MLSRFVSVFVLSVVGAFASVTLAQTGDIQVGLIDTGTNATVNIAPGGFDFFSNTPDTSDQTETQHGTVSSLNVNEAAPGIPIVPLKVTDGAFETSQSATDAAILRAAATPGIRTISISEGSTGVSSTIADAASAGKFIAVRAGNDAAENPNPLSVSSFGLPGVVIVGATDGAGGPLFFTNNAGVTAERFVRTLGVTSFSPLSGTSFAAARMAGIAAEVLRATPFLTGEQLAQVIFAAAEDFGAPGVDPVYGQGFVRNAAQVINSPAGQMQIPSSDGGGGGGGSGAAAAALIVGVGAGAAILLRNKQKLKKTLILDSFGRPFTIDLTETTRVKDHAPNIAQFIDAIDERYNAHRLSLPGDNEMRLSYSTRDTLSLDPERHFALPDDAAFRDQGLDWSLSVRGGGQHGFHYQADRYTDADYNFGIVQDAGHLARNGGVSFLSGQTFTTPYLGFGNRSDSLKLGYRFRDGFDIRFGVVDTHDDIDYGTRSVAAVLEGAYQFQDAGAVGLQFGRLNEAGSLFGGASNGAFGVDSTTTYAFNLSGTWRFSPHLSLIGNYGVGYSSVADAGQLLRNFSGIRSDWFGLGIIGHDLFTENDQLGVAISQPLRVQSGEVDMHVPYARDFAGNIFRHVDRISLAPNGTEHTLETYYRYQLNRNAQLGAYLMVQHEPSHFAETDTEVTLLSTLKLQF